MPQPGEIWVAKIPFTDEQASKIRPVLVLWEDMQDVVVAAITSAAPRSLTDVELKDWPQEGLVKSSTVRLSRLDCLEKLLLKRRLGRLSLNDAAAVRSVWFSQVKPRF